MYQRESLLQSLRANVVEVHFNKADGQSRIMKCTLKKNLLPESYQTSLEEQQEEKTFHQENPEVIAVWDIEKVGWRSFRIDSVYYVNLVDIAY
jgi:hypothetical protein